MHKKHLICLHIMALCSFLIFTHTVQADIFNRKNVNSNNGKVYNSVPKEEPKPEKDSTEEPATEEPAQKNKAAAPKKEIPNAVPDQSELKALNIYPYYMGAAKYCSHEWTSQICMKTLSEASLVMTSHFAEDLNNNNFGDHLEDLKQHCAASTAATKVKVPPHAQRSAIVECVNHIVDVSEKTGVKPDPNFYQLMVGAVLCFDKNASCMFIEQGLDSALAAHTAK